MKVFTDQLLSQHLKENDLVLDIETTGVHRQFSQIQLVGLLSKKNKGQANFYQLLASSPEEEKDLLECLAKKIEEKNIISFNGINFDMPFIYARMQFHGIDRPRIKGHFDIYAYLIQNRYFFESPGYSLQAMEDMLGIDRYENFEKKEDKDFYRQIDDEKFAKICLHNKYDVINTEKLLEFTNNLKARRTLDISVDNRPNRLYLQTIKINNNKCRLKFTSSEANNYSFNKGLNSLFWKENQVYISFAVVEGYVGPGQLAYVHIQDRPTYIKDSSPYQLDPRLLVILHDKKIELKNIIELTKSLINLFINKHV